MIFVTVGMDRFQFNRLIKTVDEYCMHHQREAFIQLGASDYIPKHCRWSQFLSFHDMQSMINSASYVISHAGAGTILACNDSGKIPLVVPRLKLYGEAIDDHQVAFARAMHEQRCAVDLTVEQLEEMITANPIVEYKPNPTKKKSLALYLDRLTRDIAA